MNNEPSAKSARQPNEYWRERVSQSLDEHGVRVTCEQLDLIALDVEGAHETYGESMGYDRIPNPITTELKATQAKLDRELRMVFCQTCRGTGRIQGPCGPTRSFDSQCDVCHGTGKHL